MQVKEVTKTALRNVFTDITGNFNPHFNWNLYSINDVVKDSSGVKYKHRGIVNKYTILLERIN